MSLSGDLISQARLLVGVPSVRCTSAKCPHEHKGRPRQADLRRGVSSAYYALFHLFSEEAAKAIYPGSPVNFPDHARRAISHTDVSKVARAITSSTLNKVLSPHFPGGIDAGLQGIAHTLVALQVDRHHADYDFSKNISRSNAEISVDRAEKALNDWKTVRTTVDAAIFLRMIFLWKQLQDR